MQRVLMVVLASLLVGWCGSGVQAQSPGEAVKKGFEAEKGSTKAASKDGVEMVTVPAGEFLMGRNGNISDEKPKRAVYLDAYQIDKFEVTVARYKVCVEAGKCGVPRKKYDTDNWGVAGRENHPVNAVVWDDAVAYCAWVNKRLPTEAEWEKAARGTDGRRYAWGDFPPGPESGPLGNFADETAKKNETRRTIVKGYNDGYAQTAPVGSFQKGVSPYGVHDMNGNVWEWVSDWYETDYYKKGANRNPQGPERGEYRVRRGGSWFDRGDQLISANRSVSSPNKARGYIGFRCAR